MICNKSSVFVEKNEVKSKGKIIKAAVEMLAQFFLSKFKK